MLRCLQSMNELFLKLMTEGMASLLYFQFMCKLPDWLWHDIHLSMCHTIVHCPLKPSGLVDSLLLQTYFVCPLMNLSTFLCYGHLGSVQSSFSVFIVPVLFPRTEIIFYKCDLGFILFGQYYLDRVHFHKGKMICSLLCFSSI